MRDSSSLVEAAELQRARRDACVSAYQMLIAGIIEDPEYHGPPVDSMALARAAAVYEKTGDEGPWQREMRKYR